MKTIFKEKSFDAHKPYVYACFASEDEEAVRKDVERLQDAGFNVCANNPKYVTYSQCKSVIFWLSRYSLTDRDALALLNLASRRRTAIPVFAKQAEEASSVNEIDAEAYAMITGADLTAEQMGELSMILYEFRETWQKTFEEHLYGMTETDRLAFDLPDSTRNRTAVISIDAIAERDKLTDAIRCEEDLKKVTSHFVSQGRYANLRNSEKMKRLIEDYTAIYERFAKVKVRRIDTERAWDLSCRRIVTVPETDGWLFPCAAAAYAFAVFNSHVTVLLAPEDLEKLRRSPGMRLIDLSGTEVVTEVPAHNVLSRVVLCDTLPENTDDRFYFIEVRQEAGGTQMEVRFLKGE